MKNLKVKTIDMETGKPDMDLTDFVQTKFIIMQILHI